MIAVILWLTSRPKVWAFLTPLGLLSYAAVVGLLATLAVSPTPLSGAYWALAYLSVLAILRLDAFNGESLEPLKRLIRLNWFLTAAIGTAVLAVYLPVVIKKTLPSFYPVYASAPSIAGIPMVLSTGLARYWAVITLVALTQMLFARQRRWQVMWSLVFGVAAAMVYLCQSRTAIIGCLGAALCVLWLAGRRGFLTAALMACGIILVLGHEQVGTVLRRFFQVDKIGGPLSGRPYIWTVVLQLWTDSPLLGFGFHADRILLQGPYTTHTSNAFLHVVLQAGLLGLSAFLAAWCLAWWLLIRAARRPPASLSAERMFTVQVCGILAFFFIRSCFESSGAFFGVDWLLMAPLFAYAQRQRAATAMPPSENISTLPTFRVLGTRVHAVELPQAVALMERWVAQGTAGRYVVATGVHGLMEAHRDRRFQGILNRADLFVPDGYSLVWLARRKGVPLRRRVCGTELLWAFCRLASQRGYRVFFYGDTEEVLVRLRERLHQAFPQLNIAGSFSPPFRSLTPQEDEAVVRMINAASPDVVWVGLGLPKQERWIVEHRHRLQAPVLVAVGAAFKFVSGVVKRAPRWMGDHGLEWLWRFFHEPRKLWRRALIDVPQFVGLTALEFINAVAKRTFDVVISGVGLLMSLPLWLVISALIKREDQGPVFYTQLRVGRGGRRFRSRKFRTMVPDADQRFGPVQAGPEDPRVTKTGRWLRTTALDELPQLLNILKGDMTFVGPRALAPTEIEVRGNGSPVALEDIPGCSLRHQVRPGLTGLAQIYAPRDVPRRDKFRYDHLYIRRQSLWLDVRLFFLSLGITLRRKWESRDRKL
jgi:N-acetylglucosaminyldiphosphoundecaprenol N-acetyl-beta-D-mannosaminyltransferase